MQNLGICRNFDIADSVWINLKDVIETKYKFVRTKFCIWEDLMKLAVTGNRDKICQVRRPKEISNWEVIKVY